MSTTLNRETISALLTHHAVCRKACEWPLLNYQEMFDLKCKVHKEQLYKYDNTDVLLVGSIGPYRDPDVKRKPIVKLHESFPLMERILNIIPGSIVVAGGAVFRAMQRDYIEHGTDVDIFFHSMPYEDAEKALQAFIVQLIKEFPKLIHVTRNSMVTTLYVKQDTEQEFYRGTKYQFVHRVYPNKSCIIGGFDLDCSAVLYDGHEILGTPLFAFTYSREVLIADLSRLSTSHSDRVRKYMGYGLVRGMMFTTRSNQEMANRISDALVKVDKCNLWIGGGLSTDIYAKDEGYYFTLAKRVHHKDDGTVVDYEGYDNSDAEMARANTQMLLRGKFTHLKWGGNVPDTIFNPTFREIPIMSPKKLKKWFEHCDHSTITSAVRWLPYETLKPLKGRPGEEIKALFTPECIESLANAAACNLKITHPSQYEVKWLAPNDNPGRQFTSSFHPIDDVIGWYNPKIYKPFKIGVQPNIWATVRCAQKRGDGPLGILSRDCLRVIFGHVWRLIGEQGRKIALCL